MTTPTTQTNNPPATGPSGSDPNYTSFTPINSWEVQMLTGLGLPITKVNVSILDAWAASENTINHNNPLAISGNYTGATNCIAQCGGSSPVMAYDTLGNGVNATVNFLQHGYSNIINTMAVNTYSNVGQSVPSGVLGAAWGAINSSSWCKGCQGGKYPVRLSDLQNGIPLNWNGINVAATGPTINQATPSQQGAVTPGVGPINPLSSIADFLTKLTNTKFWKRVLFGFLGLLMIVGGIFMIISEKTSKAAEQVVDSGTIKEVPL